MSVFRPLSKVLAVVAVLFASAAAAVPSLVPVPVQVVPQPGEFVLDAATPLIFDKRDAFAANYLRDLLNRTRGIALAKRHGAPAITLRRDPSVSGKEAYRLDVAPSGATIRASDSAGMFYGAITFWQLATQTPGKANRVTIPSVGIIDGPRFAWRGLLLDSVRHFQSVAFIQSFLDAMAREKLNVLQWHLTDDQGWRLEIRKYPRLTQIGGWRVPAGEAAQHDIDPKTGKPRLYGGFYTQGQVREIVAYAAARHITIVPEIEMPGHAQAAIVAYPWLGSVSDAPTQVSSDWGVFPYLYNVDDRTFRFLEDVLTETMALFPGAYIHVGGDEAVKDQWKANPAIQAKMHALGLANEDALQSWFIARIGTFLKAHGRRLIGWDEILQGGVPPDATITSWRGIDGAITAAKDGHDTVLSPAPVLYLDNRQVEGAGEPSGRGAVVPLSNVYDFDLAPASLSDAERAHIIGVQANIWTEHIREPDNVAYAAFPRAAALAELGWSPAATHDRAGFLARMPAELDRYAALGLPHSAHLDGDPPNPASSTMRDSHELTLCSNAIALSIEGPAPLTGKRPVYLHDIMNPCWIWPKADLDGVAQLSLSAGQLPFNFQIGADLAKVAKRPAATPDGEFEVHIDTCDGEKIATIAMPHPAPNAGLVTVRGPIAAPSGAHDLCLMFTTPRLEPYWALHTIELGQE
ncbi:MAG: family 20 glycosylhydrolase [Alphaproteobacteria bacterium]|nr:family 20 glycosylhydrolase [Alphaproteobacteria bacterium]MBL7096548.1 family 20 glycosylhydrolase [Alphaproteobacteria bacterium]